MARNIIKTKVYSLKIGGIMKVSFYISGCIVVTDTKGISHEYGLFEKTKYGYDFSTFDDKEKQFRVYFDDMARAIIQQYYIKHI